MTEKKSGGFFGGPYSSPWERPMTNKELEAKAARMADRVMGLRLHAATPDCQKSREFLANAKRKGWW